VSLPIQADTVDGNGARSGIALPRQLQAELDHLAGWDRRQYLSLRRAFHCARTQLNDKDS
jgi:hypothetical protein